jgi:hypothetical protein
LRGHSCLVSASSDEEGGGDDRSAPLLPRGDAVVELAAAGWVGDRRCRHTVGEEYHVIAVVEGHELETPEAEHRLGLERLLKTPHIDLNGKVFVNTQQSPT